MITSQEVINVISHQSKDAFLPSLHADVNKCKDAIELLSHDLQTFRSSCRLRTHSNSFTTNVTPVEGYNQIYYTTNRLIHYVKDNTNERNIVNMCDSVDEIIDVMSVDDIRNTSNNSITNTDDTNHRSEGCIAAVIRWLKSWGKMF